MIPEFLIQKRKDTPSGNPELSVPDSLVLKMIEMRVPWAMPRFEPQIHCISHYQTEIRLWPKREESKHEWRLQ